MLFSYTVWRSAKQHPIKIAYILKKLNEQKEMIKNPQKANRSILNTSLGNRLIDDDWLLAFSEVYPVYDFSDMDPQDHTLFMKYIVELFNTLTSDYRQMQEDEKAFFTYIIYELMPSYGEWPEDQQVLKQLAKKLTVLMHSPSFYVRINTFRALVKIGYTEYIFYALTVLNDHLEMRNTKFFSDYLLELKEDNKELADRMLSNIIEFSPEMQIMIVNYLRLLPASSEHQQYNEVVFKLMLDPKTHPEVVIAAILYFGRHAYDRAYDQLLTFISLDLENTNGYNYAAVAARALVNYPSESTKQALLQNLGNQNWYVRFNCADSLISLDVDYEAIIATHPDRYARDMIIHRHEVAILKRGGELQYHGND